MESHGANAQRGSALYGGRISSLLCARGSSPMPTCPPAHLQRVWQLLLDNIEDDGDFGVTTIDRDAIAAWANHLAGRRQLEELLRSIADATLESVKAAVSDGVNLAEHTNVNFRTRGQREMVVHPQQERIFLSIALRSGGPERMRVQFRGDAAGVFFSVEASDDAARLSDARRTMLRERIEPALGEQFETDHRTYWAHVYEPQEWLGSPDEQVPERLLAFVRADAVALAASGIFKGELERREAVRRP